MRIEEGTTGRALSAVGLELTVDEARELVDSLETLLGSPPGRHEHVPSADYQTELTVWIAPTIP
jgi:hypothetical protein